jgi:hypothetical protein
MTLGERVLDARHLPTPWFDYNLGNAKTLFHSDDYA